jgi:glyoxylase-like metal-dependent hydrolase (beta-lactamase superfamily II)
MGEAKDPTLQISSRELKGLLDAQRVEFIFDLRGETEFAAWRVEGRAPVETLNIPTVDFVGEEEKYLDRLPRDRRIVIVCPHGDASLYSAEVLRERGFDAVSLAGGMDAWSVFYEAHPVPGHAGVTQVHRPARGCLAYLVVSKGEAAAVDAPRHLEPILAAASAAGARITHVFDTHLQADHISGGPALAAQTGAVYHLHPEDFSGARFPFRPLADAEEIAVGDRRIRVMHAPGHTPGSCALLLDGRAVLTGDTLMKGGPGRPDLGGMVDAWTPRLHETLTRRLGALPPQTLVLPAHSAALAEQDAAGVVCLSLEEARAGARFPRGDVAAFLRTVLDGLPAHPARYDEIRKVNLGLLDPDEAHRAELEIGKNLCGLKAARAAKDAPLTFIP